MHKGEAVFYYQKKSKDKQQVLKKFDEFLKRLRKEKLTIKSVLYDPENELGFSTPDGNLLGMQVIYEVPHEVPPMQ